MFSGIVEGTGKVTKLISKKDHISIEVSPPKNFNKKLKKGASVSVDGVCLTSIYNGDKKLRFDVIEETLKRTNLKLASKGSIVNLERSINASSEIGGHLMSGHIHFTGKVNKDSFYIHLIPETLSVTNLNDLKSNSLVNVEIDQNTIAIVETVKNTLAAKKSR